MAEAAWQLYRNWLSEPDTVDPVESDAGDKLRTNFRLVADELVPLPAVPVAVPKPATVFDWFAYDVKQKADGTFWAYSTTTGRPLDVADLAPAVTGPTVHQGYPGGSDSNNGLTPATSFLTLDKACQTVAAGGTIYAFGKTNQYSTGLVTPGWAPTGHVRIIGVGAPAIFSAHLNLTWTLQTGSTYKATRSAVAWVWDSKSTRLAADGSFERLTKPGSYDGVSNLNAGEWFTIGTTVYVRTFDSRNLIGDTDIRVFLDVPFATFTGSKTLYLENVAVHGGAQAMAVTASGSNRVGLVAKDCEFSYSYTGTVSAGDALTVTGADVWLQNVRSVHSKKDGFSYEVSGGGQVCRVVELDCYSVRHGYDLQGINNASTIHSAGSIVRVGGEYAYTEGPVIADVNSSTSWNVGVYSHDALKATGDRFNFLVDGTMWLDTCTSNATNDPTCYELYASAGTIKVRNPVFPRANFYTPAGGAGTLTFVYP